MKSYTVLTTFPELAASKAQQTATVEANKLPCAVKRALEEIVKRQGIKGRRINSCKIVIVCNGDTKSKGKEDDD